MGPCNDMAPILRSLIYGYSCLVILVVLFALWSSFSSSTDADRTASTNDTEAIIAMHTADASTKSASTPLNTVKKASAGRSLEAVDQLNSLNIISDLDLLAELEQALPNNRYWALAAPTDIEAIKADRSEIEDEHRQRYALIENGYATELDIKQHFDYISETSQDFIEFSEYVISNYSEQLAPQNLQMHRLSIELHQSRLRGIDDQMAKAYSKLEHVNASAQLWTDDPEMYLTKLNEERERALLSLSNP